MTLRSSFADLSYILRTLLHECFGRKYGNTISLGTITIDGGAGMPNGNGAGGKGRIAIYYYNSLTGGPSANSYIYLQYVDPNVTPTATATPTGATATATPTLTPPPAGWQTYNYTYSATIPHAVTSVTRPTVTDTYQYDQNGNMTCRVEKSIVYLQTYNTENRIASIAKLASGDCTTPGYYASKWDFGYDGDGARTSTLTTPYDANGNPQTATLTAYYFGGAYEVTGSSTKKYYNFGGQTILRDSNSTGLQYFITDHLGSTVATLAPGASAGVTDISGSIISQQRYLPFGQVRSDIGSITQTDLGYTGQRALDPGMGGLMDYHARFYSPALGRFTQPDTIIPSLDNPQNLNRFTYGLNNPSRYTDPTGHICVDKGTTDSDCTRENFSDYKKYFTLANNISRKYKNITVQNPGRWRYGDLQEILAGLDAINGKNGFNGNSNAFVAAFGNATFVPVANGTLGKTGDVDNIATTLNGIVSVTPNADMWSIVHEMGHVLSAAPTLEGRTKSSYGKMYSNVFDHTQPGTTDYGTRNTGEDFADSFYAVIRYGPNNMPPNTISLDRIQVITALIQSYIDFNQTTGR